MTDVDVAENDKSQTVNTDETPFRVTYFNSHRKAENEFACVYYPNLAYASLAAHALAEIDLQMLDLKEGGFNMIDVERWDEDEQEWVSCSDTNLEEQEAV